MKYVVILIVVVILVRIDVILRLFDKTATKYQNSSSEIKSGEVIPSTEIIPAGKELSSQSTPRKTFLSILNDFSYVPDVNFKNKAIELLRANPTMFNDKLDSELESSLYRWRNLLVQRNKVTHDFLMEMMKSLKGENLEMLKRFFSFAIDIDLPEFLALYSKSSDINCMIIVSLGDNLPIEEKYNELAERLSALDKFLSADREEAIKAYAQRCQMVLKLQVDKLKVIVAPNDDALVAPSEEAQASPVVPTSSPIIAPGNTP
jgi:hypothetical protein